MSSRRSRRRIGAGLTAAIIAVTGASVIGAPAAASPASDDPTVATNAVTLITGDVAVVSYTADGTASATLTTTEDFYTQSFGDDLYLVPTSAAPMLAAGTLDTELFNVTGLVRSGYHDAGRDDIPVIATGSLPRARGLDNTATLSSIGATAFSIDKDQTGELFTAVKTARSANTKLWLDIKVEGTELDPTTGVTQTGADQVWDLGYDGEGTTVAVLDTGYDPNHPDLAGQVIGEQDFTGAGSAVDNDGHGTHVASTIAGTGEASDGTRSGAAPGTDLLIGKVLGFGGGQASWIIAGMEWAVESGADVVNMSLGSSEPTDCTDPMSEAVRALSQQDETLFVIAAGNAALRETVSSPGCVESVLTVGAVDADGETASFSSRGPTLGSLSVKPDIAAPGVAITGAANGSPGDNHYTRMSGTSMATPHTAAAAALVRQAHPEWTAQQVKYALTSTTKDKKSQDTVYAQGSGELWVPDAINAEVIATSSVTVGQFSWPHDGKTSATESITYTNFGDKQVKLKLKVEDLVGANGKKMPNKAVALGSKQIIVPAGGKVTVPVTATNVTKNVDDSSFGEISGRIVATGGGHRVVSAIGYWLEPETVDLSLQVIDRTGQAATSGYVDVFHMDVDRLERYYFDGSSSVDIRARVGTVSVSGFVNTPGADKSYTYVGEPEIQLTESQTITFDSRDATRVKVTTDQASQARSATLHYTRDDGRWLALGSVYAADTDVAMYALPTKGKKAKLGEFSLSTYWRMYASGVDTKDSPFVYNLAFTETGKVSKKHDHKVKDNQLATVDETFYAQRAAGTYYDTVKAKSPVNEEVFAGTGMAPIATPAERTAYYSPGIAWQQMGIGADSRLGSDIMLDPFTVYEARDHRETTWNRLVTNTGLWVDAEGAPGRVAERQANLMGFSFAQFKDGEPGRYGLGGFGDVGNLRVYRDGELAYESGWPAGQLLVPAEQADYEATVTNMRFQLDTPQLPDSVLSLATTTTFGFSSARPNGEDVASLPILMPNYDLDVDLYNLVEATDVPISVGFTTQDGHRMSDIVELSAQVTFDDVTAMEALDPSGLNWIDVDVEFRDGQWVLLVDNSQGAGSYASLHIKATDADGNTVEQHVFRLYGVA